MKNFKLNDVSKKILAALIWLLTFAVISTTSNLLGTGWFGMLTFYAGALFLVFVLFDDEYLKNQVKLALLVAVIFGAATLVVNLADRTFDILNIVEYKTVESNQKYVDINGNVTKAVLVHQVHTLPYFLLDVVTTVVSYARAFVLVIALVLILVSKGNNNKDAKENAKAEAKEEKTEEVNE